MSKGESMLVLADEWHKLHVDRDKFHELLGEREQMLHELRFLTEGHVFACPCRTCELIGRLTHKEAW